MASTNKSFELHASRQLHAAAVQPSSVGKAFSLLESDCCFLVMIWHCATNLLPVRSATDTSSG
jgi:hypothetical protein